MIGAFEEDLYRAGKRRFGTLMKLLEFFRVIGSLINPKLFRFFLCIELHPLLILVNAGKVAFNIFGRSFKNVFGDHLLYGYN